MRYKTSKEIQIDRHTKDLGKARYFLSRTKNQRRRDKWQRKIDHAEAEISRLNALNSSLVGDKESPASF